MSLQSCSHYVWITSANMNLQRVSVGDVARFISANWTEGIMSVLSGRHYGLLAFRKVPSPSLF